MLLRHFQCIALSRYGVIMDFSRDTFEGLLERAREASYQSGVGRLSGSPNRLHKPSFSAMPPMIEISNK